MRITEKFNTFIFELIQNDKLKINKENISDIISDELYLSKRMLNLLQEKYKITPPQKDFQYEHINGLILDWSCSYPNSEYLFGGFLINGILSPMTTPSHFWDTYNSGNRAWKNNPYPKDEAIYEEFLPKLNYFHKSGHGDDGTFGCFLREEGGYPCPIYFYDSGIWFPLDLSLQEYYEAMIACNAVYYWQYFYVDTDLIVEKLGNYKPIYEQYGAKYATGPCPFLDKYKKGELVTSAEGVLLQMEKIIEIFPKIFPNYDVTFFTKKYNALKKGLEKI